MRLSTDTYNFKPLIGRYVYAITISSNLAKDNTANLAYKYIISQFPSSTFLYVREVSKSGKHHIHGIMSFKYSFDFEAIMAARRPYKVHLHYDKLLTDGDQYRYYNYMHHPDRKPYVYSKNIDPSTIKILVQPPYCCIPQQETREYYAPLTIKGLK